MKTFLKSVIILFFVTISFSACSKESPVTLEMEQAYNQAWNFFYPKIVVTAIENNVEIEKISINKGNCKFTDYNITYDSGFKTKELFPAKLNEYQELEIRVDKNCRVKVVDLVINKNEWSFSFEQ
jgi:hypothetical protein